MCRVPTCGLLEEPPWKRFRLFYRSRFSLTVDCQRRGKLKCTFHFLLWACFNIKCSWEKRENEWNVLMSCGGNRPIWSSVRSQHFSPNWENLLRREHIIGLSRLERTKQVRTTGWNKLDRVMFPVPIYFTGPPNFLETFRTISYKWAAI